MEQKADISKDSLEVLYSVAYQHLRGGQFLEAEKLLYSLVIFEPTSTKYWKALAFAQQKQKQYDEACATYALISKMNPEDPEPYLRVAECFFSTGEVNSGIEALGEAEARIQQAPKYRLELTRLQEAWITRKR